MSVHFSAPLPPHHNGSATLSLNGHSQPLIPSFNTFQPPSMPPSPLPAIKPEIFAANNNSHGNSHSSVSSANLGNAPPLPTNSLYHRDDMPMNYISAIQPPLPAFHGIVPYHQLQLSSPSQGAHNYSPYTSPRHTQPGLVFDHNPSLGVPETYHTESGATNTSVGNTSTSMMPSSANSEAEQQQFNYHQSMSPAALTGLVVDSNTGAMSDEALARKNMMIHMSMMSAMGYQQHQQHAATMGISQSMQQLQHSQPLNSGNGGSGNVMEQSSPSNSTHTSSPELYPASFQQRRSASSASGSNSRDRNSPVGDGGNNGVMSSGMCVASTGNSPPVTHASLSSSDASQQQHDNSPSSSQSLMQQNTQQQQQQQSNLQFNMQPHTFNPHLQGVSSIPPLPPIDPNNPVLGSGDPLLLRQQQLMNFNQLWQLRVNPSQPITTALPTTSGVQLASSGSAFAQHHHHPHRAVTSVSPAPSLSSVSSASSPSLATPTRTSFSRTSSSASSTPRTDESSFDDFQSHQDNELNDSASERALPDSSKLHVCAECSKRFSTAARLANHSRCHSNSRPYECRACQKHFNHKGSLTRHLRTHTGDKPHACEVCGKRFFQHGNLTVHLRTHTGERPFQCTHCGKRFNHRSSLTVHAKNHNHQ